MLQTITLRKMLNPKWNAVSGQLQILDQEPVIYIGHIILLGVK
jgi:hypothetical protein